MEGLAYGNIKRSLFGQRRDQGLLSSKQTRRSLHRGFLKTAQDGGPNGRLSGRAGGGGRAEGGGERGGLRGEGQHSESEPDEPRLEDWFCLVSHLRLLHSFQKDFS